MVVEPAKGPEKKPETLQKPESKGKEEAKLPAPATIVVNLPAEAKLTIDDAATTSTSSTRVFASPALEPGRDYFYTLKAEVVRDGKTVTATKRITVHAGEETQVSLEVPVGSVAQR
jgi:uncharacterized protein (TIGR03000 family)